MTWNSNSPLKLTETQLQKQFFTWVRVQYPKYKKRIYAIPNGGLRNVVVATNLKKEGVEAGVWDIFVSIPIGDYKGAYIETKVGKNKLTEHQKAFKKANEKDYFFGVYYTLEEGQELLNNYLNNKI